VEIDSLQQTAILRPSAGFIGDAGALAFQVRDAVTGEQAVTVATPVQVIAGSGPLTSGLLEISVVVNPIRKNFLDVFVSSRRDLLSDPFLGARIGTDPTTKPAVIPVNSVERVSNMWVGDLVLTDEVTGEVELSATGITQTTRVALTDTLRLQVERAGVRSTFSLSTREVAVRLPAGSIDKASVVALIPERGTRLKELSKPASGGSVELEPASGAYRFHAPDAAIRQPGEIRFRSSLAEEDAARAGVYLWDEAAHRWQFTGSRLTGSRFTGVEVVESRWWGTSPPSADTGCLWTGWRHGWASRSRCAKRML
jgi:hypothetical protein